MARILVVEDYEDFSDMVKKLLLQKNHTVVVASNGLKAAWLIEHEDFDLVITDIIMPDEDGIGLISHIHNAKRKPPVIVMTGGGTHISVEFIKEYAEHIPEVVHFLKKPFDNELLLKLVADVLEKTDSISQ